MTDTTTDDPQNALEFRKGRVIVRNVTLLYAGPGSLIFFEPDIDYETDVRDSVFIRVVENRRYRLAMRFIATHHRPMSSYFKALIRWPSTSRPQQRRLTSGW